MPKYDVTIFHSRFTSIEISAPNEEAACIMARERIHKDGLEAYRWEDEPSSEEYVARIIPDTESLKLGKMIDKLRSWGLFVEELKTPDGNIYGYLVTGNIDCTDFDAGFALNLDREKGNTAENFLAMWQKAVRDWDPDVALWRWLKTLPDCDAQDMIRPGLGYFDDFYRYLRKTVGDMTAYLRKLEAEE